MASNPSNRSHRSGDARSSDTGRGAARSGDAARRRARRDEELVEREEAEANDLQDQAPYQASPLIDEPRVAREKETSTGANADQAAGIAPHKNQLADSEEAFERSRGSHEPRTKGYQRDR